MKEKDKVKRGRNGRIYTDSTSKGVRKERNNE